MFRIRANRNFVLLLIFTAVIGSASENGVAEEQNKDRTGSPDGSTTCTQCHNGGYFNLLVDFSVKDVNGMAVSSYLAGDTYDLRFMMLTLAGPSAAAYGFQTTALFSDLSDAGTFSMPGANVQLEEVNTEDIPSRHIAEHSQPNPSGIFNVKWTAPAVDSDTVFFYYSATAVNLDNDNSGDNGSNGSFTLIPALPDHTAEEVFQELELIFSNDILQINSAGKKGVDAISCYDLSGRLLYRTTINESVLSLAIPNVHSLIVVAVEREGQVYSKVIGRTE